jgi:hypothetical protein
LADKNVGRADDRVLLADIIPAIADLPSWDDISDDGVRLQSAANTDLRFKGQHAFTIDAAGARDSSLELVLVEQTFGTEELSAYASCLGELEPEPCATMHTNDAKALKLADGDRIAIETDSGSLEILLRVTDNMAGGILVVPRFHGVNWQIFSTGNVVIGKEKIKKVG